MGIPIGAALLGVGAVLAYLWRDAVLIFLQGLTAFSLIFWGIVVLIAAVAQKRAHRLRNRSFHDEKSVFESSETPGA